MGEAVRVADQGMHHVVRKPRSSPHGLGLKWGAWLWIATFLSLSAHRLDEILHSTLVHLDSERIRLVCSLTPGSSLATHFVRTIDINRDGVLSDLELLAVGSAYSSNLVVQLNGKPLTLTLVDARADELSLLTEGTGMVRLEFESGRPGLVRGTNRLFVINHPKATNAICLIHAALPRQTNVVVLHQSRDTNQFENRIEFLWSSPSAAVPARRHRVQLRSFRRAHE